MTDKKARPEEEIVFGDDLPVLPIRNAVLFPGAVAPFDVGREKSVALVEDVDNLGAPVIAILLWAYFVGRLIVTAAFVNAERWRRSGERAEPSEGSDPEGPEAADA